VQVEVFGSGESPPLCMTLCGGNRVWSGHRNGEVVCFDVSSRCALATKSQKERVDAIGCWQSCVFSGGKDGSIQIWNSELSSSLTTKKEGKKKVGEKLKTLLKGKNKSLKFRGGGEITSLLCLGKDILVSGDRLGQLVLWESNQISNQFTMDGGKKQPITSLCRVGENKIWIGAGCDLFVCSTSLGDCCAIKSGAHTKYIKDIIFVGTHVWSCSKKEIHIWDISSRSVIRTQEEMKAIHCMSIVNLDGNVTVWVGGDDEIVVWDVQRKLAIRTLKIAGDVTCVMEVGMNFVWVGMRYQDHGSIMEWDLNNNHTMYLQETREYEEEDDVDVRNDNNK